VTFPRIRRGGVFIHLLDAFTPPCAARTEFLRALPFPQLLLGEALTSQANVVVLFVWVLAGLSVGVSNVGSAERCHGEATTRVAVIHARNGPKGNAAGHRTDPSVKVELAVTFTLSGTCWTATSILRSGRPGRSATLNLSARVKTLT
jgi:hypothetical protein